MSLEDAWLVIHFPSSQMQIKYNKKQMLLMFQSNNKVLGTNQMQIKYNKKHNFVSRQN